VLDYVIVHFVSGNVMLLSLPWVWDQFLTELPVLHFHEQNVFLAVYMYYSAISAAENMK